jgi:Ser/Thr protein kinase RdoA (MazF antagonist)
LSVEPNYRPVLAFYPGDCQPERVEFLATAGGFSGALFWRLQSARGSLVLRRWPQEHPSPVQLPQIQRILQHVDRAGFRLLPVPIATIAGPTFVDYDDYLWELTPWLPGESSYARTPSPTKLAHAMQALARFHRAAESFPSPRPAHGPSPGLRLRLDRLRWWATTGLDQLRAAISSFPIPHSTFPIAAPFPIPHSPFLIASASLLCDLFAAARPEVESCLIQALELRVALQPCIRDVWRENVLFSGDEVSGLIDFGALEFDNVATDVARLLASLVADDPQGWRAGLTAYESVRKLSAAEAVLVAAFDRANVLLSGLNWCRWHYLDGREFADRARMLARVDEHLQRLTRLVAHSSRIA